MLDIQFIKNNREEVEKAIQAKHSSLDLTVLLAKSEERVLLIQDIEELKSLKNDINDLIHQAKSEEERVEIIAKGKDIKMKLDEKEPLFEEVKKEYDELMAQVPNIISGDTPIGTSEEQNVETFNSGAVPTFDFIPRTHIELGMMLDIIDFERGTKVSGYRGYYLKNEGMLLVMGLMMYAVQKLVSKGYTPMIPPTLVKGFPLFGSGYFKGAQYDGAIDEIYQVATSDKEADGSLAKEEKFLVGTAEPSLLAYYSGEVLEEKNLPVKFAGFSQCYRSEIGSYGKDTKGMYRVHEFMKVEQVVITTADMSSVDALQDEMIAISEEMHQELGLPYRKIQICSGDMSAGKYRAFDLEAWMPGMNRYGETGSASNFLDWQSRRLNVKYKDATTGERKYAFMLNNTALPSPRILIAILENYQNADGSVSVPEVLQPFVGKAVIEAKKG
ncbi:MAG: serine--tRNA ligase [Candidatus Moranbacteria bacterium]|nr:serine--tRNA ligase [Candidatus Moranbacteria bacterium]MDD3964982.1 serine--tRNA ligase [Candidatus Moranbacteria bacterium]